MKLLLVIIPQEYNKKTNIIPRIKTIHVAEQNLQFSVLDDYFLFKFWIQKSFVNDNKLHESQIGPYAVFTDKNQALTFFIEKLKERENTFQQQADFFRQYKVLIETILEYIKEEKNI